VKVELIRYTPDAFDLLLGTKTTRMRGKDPSEMTEEEKHDHWQYMLDTIESPFEFVDYIFNITDVSKNFTHQLVRTRTGAYQQETSRALDVSDNDIIAPDAFEENDEFARIFNKAVRDAQDSYRQLVAAGAQLQDARAVIPSNMSTAIKAKFNLRTLSDTAKTRLCARTQGEYQEVFRAMRAAVIAVHPWTEPLLQPHCAATGTCKFPRWGSKVIDEKPGFYDKILRDLSDGEEGHTVKTYQCPHYDERLDQTVVKRDVRIKFWSRAEIATANPVAKEGKSM